MKVVDWQVGDIIEDIKFNKGKGIVFHKSSLIIEIEWENGSKCSYINLELIFGYVNHSLKIRKVLEKLWSTTLGTS